MYKILFFLCTLALPAAGDVMMWQITPDPVIYIFANNIIGFRVQPSAKKPEYVAYIENRLDRASRRFYVEICYEINAGYLTYDSVMSSGVVSSF